MQTQLMLLLPSSSALVLDSPLSCPYAIIHYYIISSVAPLEESRKSGKRRKEPAMASRKFFKGLIALGKGALLLGVLFLTFFFALAVFAL